MILSKKHSHVRDSNIVFEEDTHKYYINKKKYRDSTTGFIGNFFDKFDPDKVIDKYYMSWQRNKHPSYYNLSKSEIKAMWSKNNAAELGTELHNNIELYWNDEDIDFNYLCKKEWGHFISFVTKNMQLKPFRTEWCIYDDDIELAGSIDMVFLDRETGKYYIYDWKRSNKISTNSYGKFAKLPISHVPDHTMSKYSLQLNMYKYILEKNYDIKIEGMYLLQLHPDFDKYIVHEVKDMQRDIKKLIKAR